MLSAFMASLFQSQNDFYILCLICLQNFLWMSLGRVSVPLLGLEKNLSSLGSSVSARANCDHVAVITVGHTWQDVGAPSSHSEGSRKGKVMWVRAQDLGISRHLWVYLDTELVCVLRHLTGPLTLLFPVPRNALILKVIPASIWGRGGRFFSVSNF